MTGAGKREKEQWTEREMDGRLDVRWKEKQRERERERTFDLVAQIDEAE